METKANAIPTSSPEAPLPAPTPASGPPTNGRDDLAAMGALAEPNRRALYDYVVTQRDWVSREQAAEAVGLRRGIAAHHLDRLAADGLLETDYQRLTGRSGPGAGRPAKLYRRARNEIGVSLPPRRYDLAGKLLSDAADRARLDGTSIDDAVQQAAGEEGQRIGASGRCRLADAATAADRHKVLFDELQQWGYEPETRNDGVTVLHNCPFHQLSQEHTELICHMNLRLLQGVLVGLDETELRPALKPEPGECCVQFHPVDPA